MPDVSTKKRLPVRWGLLCIAIGVLLLVVGGLDRQTRIGAILPFLGTAFFATGWVTVGTGFPIRNSRLLGAVAAVLVYEVIGILVVLLGQTLAFGEDLGELLKHPGAVLGFAQLWPVALLFSLQVLGYGPQ